MSAKKNLEKSGGRRHYDEELKAEAVQMLLDGHSATSICQNLGISCPSILRRWRQRLVAEAGPVGETLESRVQRLEAELQRVEREREILKKALAIFSQRM